ncbi:ankyrin repeat-containing domain protein [Trichoderma sp. SZMC 28012]
MTSIFDLALKGTLSKSDLEGKDKEIDKVDEKTFYTPLGAAVHANRKDNIKLLLAHGANPDGAPGSRPPLWIAAARTKGHIGDIVETLLAHGVNVKKADPVVNDTALHAIVQRYRNEDDLDVIEALVNAGADPKATNQRGESAESLATKRNDKKLLALLAPEKHKKIHIKDVLMITSLIIFAISWANRKNPLAMVATATVAMATAVSSQFIGPIKKRFKMLGRRSKNVPHHIAEKLEKAACAEAFKNEMNNYIKDAHLDQFFKDGKFLNHVITKAVDMEADPKTKVNVRDLTRLALYQPVLYCDDSGSMNQGGRVQLQADLGERITSLTTRLVPDDTGIELRFINTPNEPRMSKPRSKLVKQILQDIQYSGPTEIGINCKAKILEEIVYRPIKEGKFDRPVLVSILTDGCPGGPDGSDERQDTLKEVILECGRILEANKYNKKVVRFQISQIGHDKSSKDFITSLALDPALRDVLYCTTQHLDDEFKDFRDNEHRLEQWLLALLMEPIIKAD